MDGFFLLLGHLFGDYVVQNDWQAKNKTTPRPAGRRPGTLVVEGEARWTVTGTAEERAAWDAAWAAWWRGHLACTVHCVLYTLAVWACAFWWLPWWGVVVCFAAHWPVDRFRLARKWMRLVGQEQFATGPLAPWSVIAVDNTYHLLTLGLIAAAAGRVG